MIFDWDDFWPWGTEHGYPFVERLRQLKAIRPDFCCTLFAVPAPDVMGERGSVWGRHELDQRGMGDLPEWVEFAVHGWRHPDPWECSEWTVDRMRAVIAEIPSFYVHGFKAPGWQISDGCYEALIESGWWVADQAYNDHRRPAGLRAHILNVGPDHWHGHCQNVCGNGLEETWDEVVALVRAAPSFEFVSEAVRPWVPQEVAA